MINAKSAKKANSMEQEDGGGILKTYEEKRKQVCEFNLTSDLFAGKVFEDREACQELCRILLDNDGLIIKNVHTKYAIRNLENHSAELDIIAEDEKNNLINIEIQMYKEKAPFRRTRYYISNIDMSILDKGKPYSKLPGVTIVFITKEDFIGDKRGFYEINRKVGGQDVTMSLDNGISEKYFNLEYRTDDARINELLDYFKDSSPCYKTDNFPRIAERVNYYKVQKEGVNIMCEIADRIRNEGRLEGRREGLSEGIREGLIESLKNLIKNADMTIEQAMTVLEIPENDRLMYAGKINKL